MRFVFDITTLFNWRGAPVGIVRVEQELVSYILNRPEFSSTIFVRFSNDRNSIMCIPRRKVKNIIEKPNKKPLFLFVVFKTLMVVWLSFIKFLYMVITKCVGYFGIFVRYLVRKIAFFVIPNEYHIFFFKVWFAYKERGFLSCILVKYPRLRDGLYKTCDSIRYIYESIYKKKQIDFLVERGDVFIATGLLWDRANYEFYYHVKNMTSNITFVGVVYDMIPLRCPEFAPWIVEIFFKHFYYQNYLFDRLVCISNASKCDFQKLAKEYEISRFPVLETIHLGDTVVDRMSDHVEHDSVSKLINEQYVLFVSTIEIRKNHIVLLRAWLEAQKSSIEMPKLVFVGMHGWLIDDMLALYNNSSFLKKKVLFLGRVEDDVLVELYKNCLFTVFPSHIEGWGLGVVESLAYGKVCVISTDGALNEAAQGIMPRVDPNDAKEWMKTISHLAANEKERRNLELKIKNTYVPRKWEVFAKDFIDFACGEVA